MPTFEKYKNHDSFIKTCHSFYDILDIVLFTSHGKKATIEIITKEVSSR